MISTVILFDVYIFILSVAISFALFLISGTDKHMYLGDFFSPPEGITPAEARYALTGDVEKRDVFSLIFYWAQKGNILIKEDGSGLQFIKIKDLGHDSKPYERILFQSIFYEYGGMDTVHTRELAGKLFMTVWKVSGQIKHHFNSKDRSSQIKRITLITAGMILSAVPYMFLLVRIGEAISSSGSISMTGVLISVLAGMFFALPNAFISFVVRKWFTDGAEGNIGNTVRSIIIFLMVNGLMGAVCNMTGAGFGHAIKTAFFALLLSFILGLIRLRTPYKHKMYQHITGFRESVSKPAKPNAKEFLRKYPVIFYENLSYAIALNVGEKWGVKFENFIDSPPSWYQDYVETNFSSVKFGSHLENMLSLLTDELAPNPIPRGNIGIVIN